MYGPVHCVQPVSSAGWSCTARDRKNVNGQLQPNYVTLFNRMDYRLNSVPCRYITIHSVFDPLFEDVALVEFLYLVFTRMPGESYRRRLRSLLLYLCHVFRVLINSLVY